MKTKITLLLLLFLTSCYNGSIMTPCPQEYLNSIDNKSIVLFSTKYFDKLYKITLYPGKHYFQCVLDMNNELDMINYVSEHGWELIDVGRTNKITKKFTFRKVSGLNIEPIIEE